MTTRLATGRWTLWMALATLAVLFAGCARTPILDRTIEAQTARDFASWQTRYRPEFTPDQWTEFEAIQQDIKLRIIALNEATGTDAVNDALRPKIHGKTVRDAMRKGYEDRLWRLNVQREEFEKMVAGNSTLRTNEGDIASANYLRRKVADQAAQLKRTVDEIESAEAKRDALAVPVAK